MRRAPKLRRPRKAAREQAEKSFLGCYTSCLQGLVPQNLPRTREVNALSSKEHLHSYNENISS
jgi:hypothetical protein